MMLMCNKPYLKDQLHARLDAISRVAVSLIFLISVSLGLSGVVRGEDLPAGPPKIGSIFKPELVKRAMSERDPVTSAKLDDSTYAFSVLILVRASQKMIWQNLTRYELYHQLVPMCEKSDYDEKTKRLELAGGLWRFKLHSFVKFDDPLHEKFPFWLKFEIVEGSLKGVKGELFTEEAGERGTLVALNGFHSAVDREKWPPKFVMEEGAKIVLGLTGVKMRNHIEEQKKR